MKASHESRSGGHAGAPRLRWGRAVLAAVVLAVGGGGGTRRAAGDGPPVRVGEVRKAFDAALSAPDRRAALAPLAAMPADGRARLLRQWVSDHATSSEAVAVLARALADAEPEKAMGRFRALSKEKPLRAAVPAFLRVALDVPAATPADFDAILPEKDATQIELALAALGKAGAEPRSARPPGPYAGHFALAALLAAPPTATAWADVAKALADRGKEPGAWGARLADRLAGHFPTPTAEEARALPPWVLEVVAQAGSPAAAAPWLATAPAKAVIAWANGLRSKPVSPDVVASLVAGFPSLAADSPAQWSVHSVLLGVCGLDIPCDGDHWRSWWAGHEGEVRARGPATWKPTVPAVVARGVAFLLGEQQGNGGWRYAEGGLPPGIGSLMGSDWRREHSGATALVLLGLKAAGVDPAAKPVQRGRDALLGPCDPFGGDDVYLGPYTYAVSLNAMAFAALWSKSNTDALQRLTALLADAQGATTGGWTYFCARGTTAVTVITPFGKSIDLSNTQYAILALREAERAGVPVPDDAWKAVLRLMHRAERGKTGEWNYWYPKAEDPFDGSRPGMAAIAAFSMLVARSRLEKGLTVEAALADPAIDRSLRSIARRFGSAAAYRSMELYTMYSVERVGAVYGIAAFDGVPWYGAAAAALVDRQNGDGSWGGDKSDWTNTWGRVVDTAYALLVLKRATTPIFSGGLDVPADEKKPVHPFQGDPRALPGAAPEAAPESPPPVAQPDEAAGEPVRRALAEAVRTRLFAVLAEPLASGATSADRLAAALVVRRLDPLDPLAHLLCGEALDAWGEWSPAPIVSAACPSPPAPKDVDARQSAVATRLGEALAKEAAGRKPDDPLRSALTAWQAGPYPPPRDAWDDPTLHRLTEDLALRTVGGETAFGDASAFQTLAGAPMAEVKTAHLAIAFETSLLDPDLLLHEMRYGERLFAMLLDDPPRSAAAPPPARLVLLDGRRKGKEVAKSDWSKADGGASKDLRSTSPNEPWRARLVAFEALSGAWLDARTPPKAFRDAPILAALRTFLMSTLAHGAPPAANGGIAVPASALKVALPELLEVEREADRTEPSAPWIRPAADVVVRWCLSERRGPGVQLVKRILRGDSVHDAALNWPRGSDGLLDDLQARLR